MESEPKKPGDTTQNEKKSSDAAAMSARILALAGDSDEYTYAEPPPKPLLQVASPKARRRGALTKILFITAVFLLGGLVCIPVEKWSIARGFGVGIRLEKWLGSPPIVVINGEPISAADFAHASEIQAGRPALQRLIDDNLVQQFAWKMSVYPDQKDLEAKFNEMSRSPSFFQNLKRANESQDDYKNTLLVTMCKQSIVSKGIKVNPSEIQDYYNRNIDRKNRTARFYHPETVQAAVIVNPNKESLEIAQKEMAAGMSWATAALKYSADVSKSRSGVLPALRREQINVRKFPGFEQVLFDLSNGHTSDITRIGANYWLIKCLNHSPETVEPFEKVQDQCTTGLLVERGIKNHGAAIAKEEKDFVKASSITFAPNYADQYGELSPKK